MGVFDQQGGSPAFSFDRPGARIQGYVVGEPAVKPQMKFGADGKPTDLPDTWPSGEPKMKVIISLQTQLRDPNIEDDDGMRGIYAVISGSKGSCFRAIKDAIRATGRKDIEDGAFLDVWYSGDDPESANPRNPRKLYGAQYQPPAGAFGGVDTATGELPPQQAPAAPQQYQQPPMQQPVQQYQQPPAQYQQPPAQPQYPGDPGPYQPQTQVDPYHAAAGGDPWTGQPAQQQPANLYAPTGPYQPGAAFNNQPNQPPMQQPPAGYQQPQQQQPPAQPQQYQQPPMQQQQQAPVQQVNIDPAQQAQIQAMLNAGVPDAAILAATGLSEGALNAFKGLAAAPAGGQLPGTQAPA